MLSLYISSSLLNATEGEIRRKSWNNRGCTVFVRKSNPILGEAGFAKLRSKTVGLPSTFSFKDNSAQIRMTANTLVKNTNGRVESLKTFLKPSNYPSIVRRALMFKRNEHIAVTLQMKWCIMAVMLLCEQQLVSIIRTLFWALFYSRYTGTADFIHLRPHTFTKRHIQCGVWKRDFSFPLNGLQMIQLPALVENIVSCGRKLQKKKF